MKCTICGQSATKSLKCNRCGFHAAFVCDGFICQPNIWRTTDSVIPLMNMKCEDCDFGLGLEPLPGRWFVGPPHPLFPTTVQEAVAFFRNKSVVLLTNVFGDGLGDLGQGLKLASLLHDAGAQVLFVPCCLEQDTAKVAKMLAEGTPWKTVVKSTARQKINEYNNVPVIDMDVYSEYEDIKGAIDGADLVLCFPTAGPIKYNGKLAGKMISVEECVQSGTNILGFGMSSGKLNPKAQRLGVLLNDLGPLHRWNLAQLTDQALKAALLGGLELEAWRDSTFFSVGYVKEPEESPNPFLSLGGASGGGSGKGMGMEAMPVRMHGVSGPKPSAMGGLRTHSTYKPISIIGRPPMSSISPMSALGGSPSLGMSATEKPVGLKKAPKVVPNRFMDNYIKLMCLVAPADKALTLFCPNFEAGGSRHPSRALKPVEGFARHEVLAFKGLPSQRQVVVVSGFGSQGDFSKLLNEAALSGELHARPICIGAAGEGTLSEILSIQRLGQAVFPIYSPRYPYQRENMLRLTGELFPNAPLHRLFTAVMSLHEMGDPAIVELRTALLALRRAMAAAQALVHRDWNFLNLLFMRITKKG